VAEIGRAFGMHVVAWSQNLDPDHARKAHVKAVGKEDLFASSDVVTVHYKLSPRSVGLVGEAELALMKPSAYLVNTSRGPLVDSAALLAALRSGSIAGAALDVYDVEPLPLSSPLRTAPNVVLTPHLGYVTEEAYRVFYGEAVEDIVAFASGSPVRVLSASLCGLGYLAFGYPAFGYPALLSGRPGSRPDRLRARSKVLASGGTGTTAAKPWYWRNMSPWAWTVSRRACASSPSQW